MCLCLRDTWDPFQLNPVGAEKENKRRCFQIAQYLVAVIVGVAVLASAVVAKVGLCISLITFFFFFLSYSRRNRIIKFLVLNVISQAKSVAVKHFSHRQTLTDFLINHYQVHSYMNMTFVFVLLKPDRCFNSSYCVSVNIFRYVS